MCAHDLTIRVLYVSKGVERSDARRDTTLLLFLSLLISFLLALSVFVLMNFKILYSNFLKRTTPVVRVSYIYETSIFCKRRPLNTESTANIIRVFVEYFENKFPSNVSTS